MLSEGGDEEKSGQNGGKNEGCVGDRECLKGKVAEKKSGLKGGKTKVRVGSLNDLNGGEGKIDSASSRQNNDTQEGADTRKDTGRLMSYS